MQNWTSFAFTNGGRSFAFVNNSLAIIAIHAYFSTLFHLLFLDNVIRIKKNIMFQDKSIHTLKNIP